jgi:hypothetical protein
MKRVLATTILAGVATVALSTGAHAGPNANAKIMLHSLALTTKNICTRTVAPNTNVPLDCGGYTAGVSNQSLAPAYHFVYLLVVNGSTIDGVAGVQCGVDFDGVEFSGVDVFTWTLCATLEFVSTGWPQDGGGNLITWDATNRCQLTPPGPVGSVGVAGFFYMGAYSNDVMTVTPRPVDGFAKVASCGSVEDIPFGGAPTDNETPGDTFLGSVVFGSGIGINPCGRERPVPVAEATWSGVKTLIKTN